MSNLIARAPVSEESLTIDEFIHVGYIVQASPVLFHKGLADYVCPATRQNRPVEYLQHLTTCKDGRLTKH